MALNVSMDAMVEVRLLDSNSPATVQTSAGSIIRLQMLRLMGIG
jgi:hypothetical protein